MKIIQITHRVIYVYHDYQFMSFDREALIVGKEIVGLCWEGNRLPSEVSEKPEQQPAEIKAHTDYHNLLMGLLISTTAETVNED